MRCFETIRVTLMILALTGLGCARPAALSGQSPEPLRNGDIIFQQSTSSQSEAIRIATGSRYTHLGIVTIRDGQPLVFEAVQPVRLTPLETWLAAGVDGHAVVKRLEGSASVLTAEALACMETLGTTWLGRDYDPGFEWSDDRLYCSELVAKLYSRCAGVELGTMQRLQDFELDHPVVARKLQQRFGNQLPVDEPVISPESIYTDRRLRTVRKY